MGKRLIITYRFRPRETSYGRSSGDPPTPPLLEISHTFFDTAEAHEAIFFLQIEGLSDVYKSLKVQLRQGKART